jgi:hypothetical protein
MRTTILFAGAALALAAAAPAAAADWQDIKDPAALRALYSNKTFKGKDYLDRPFIGHYRTDGKGVMFFQGAKIPRTWAVEGADRVCIESQFPRACYRFQRHASKARTYRSINVANDMATEFEVEDGVPQF